ncbi:MAG: MFS transporter [Thermoprotei archaeon]
MDSIKPKTSMKRLAIIGTFRTFPVALVAPYTGLVLYLKGMPLLFVSIYYALLAVVGASGQLGGGLLSDRMGRKWTMVLGQAGSGLFLVGMGIALFGPGYAGFAAAAVVQSFFGSASFSAYNTYVGDVGINKEGLVTSYGLARIGINLGWALGPLVGGFLMGTLGYAYAFVISGLLIMLGTLLFWGLQEIKSSSFDFSPLKDRLYAFSLLPFVLVFAFIAQFGLTLTVFEQSVNSFSLVDLGLFYLINGLTVVALQYPIARFLAKRDPIKWIAVGISMYMIAFAMLAFEKSLEGVMLAVFVMTIGEDIDTPLLMTVANLLANPQKRGSYMGIYGVLSSSARSVGSSLGGGLMALYLHQPLMLWGSVDGLGALSAVSVTALTGKKLKSSSRFSIKRKLGKIAHKP